VFTNGSFVLVVFLGAIGDLLLSIFILLGFMFFVAACSCTRMYCTRRRRRCYEFFLCHHKDGSGGFCRLLKMFLQEDTKYGSQIFLDSDNLQDLSGLFGIVANQVRTLVVLCSKEILQRPWCVGEMCTAHENQIDTVLLCFPDFAWPSASFIERYSEHVEGIHSLSSYGISVDMVRKTLDWLSTRPRIVLPCRTTLSSMQSVSDKLTKRRCGKVETVSVSGMRTVDVSDCMGVVVSSGSDLRADAVLECHLQDGAPDVQAHKGRTVVSIVDHANDEAVCAALIIQRLLQVHFPLGTKVPYVVARCDDIPLDVTMALVICSNGCFQQAQVVRHLLQAHAGGSGCFQSSWMQHFVFPPKPCTRISEQVLSMRGQILEGGSSLSSRSCLSR